MDGMSETTFNHIPKNTEAEASVVGGVLVGGGSVAEVFEILDPSDFYDPALSEIYYHLQCLYRDGSPIDVVTVADALNKAGSLVKVGGNHRLINLISGAALKSTIAGHANLVREAAMRRKLISASTAVHDLALHSPANIDDVLSAAEKTIYDIAAGGSSSKKFAFAGLSEAVAGLGDLWMGGQELRGLPSGIHNLDALVSGFEKDKLYVLAARPGNGKTALALNIASNIASRSERPPVLFFSLEMGETEINNRLMASMSKVALPRLEKGNLDQHDWLRIAETAKTLDSAKLLIDDDSTVSVDDMYSRCRRAKMLYGDLGLVVVDYIQLMSGDGENRTLEVSYITRRLKIMAKDLQVPVLALSQLSRRVEERVSKRPMLSDLRESGSIEQDANTVMFIYREELYDPESDYVGMPEIIVAKQRSGPTGSVRVAFLDDQTRFCNLSRES